MSHSRSHSRSHLALPITLLVTAALAFLPPTWRLGWSKELAEVVRFPLRPFADAGSAIAAWLRPAPSEAVGWPAELKPRVEQLIEDRNVAERLYLQERRRVLDLQEQIEQLQKIPADTLRYVSRSVVARITRRNPDSPLGVVELGLGPRAAGSIRPGTVGVYAGVHLLGRTDDLPGRSACAFLPLANRATDPIRARIFPADDPRMPMERTPLVQLEPTGRGTFTAVLPNTDVVGAGDLVRLDDRRWPNTAQLMVIGEIASVAVDDTEPLRNAITVQPVYLVQQVAHVTLLVEEEVDASGAGPAGEGGGGG